MFDSEENNSFINFEVNGYLESIIQNNLFANGYIFFGAEGLGKKQTAFKFIINIFNQYSSTKNLEEIIKNNNHPDLLVIEPSSFKQIKATKIANSNKPKINNSEVIKIDQIRNIKTFFRQRSIESKKKIVLISDAHLLNEAASNCLLKILEEPSNGLFILLTSKINLLLDTIKSRCQLIRFKSFSSKQLESILKNSLESSKLEISKKFNFQDLINSSNGSPSTLLNNLEIWSEFSNEILNKIEMPLKENIEILKFSKLISEQLESFKQVSLICLIQQIWWRKTKNINLINKLEKLKSQVKNNIQIRLAWEVTLLKIAIEDL